MLTVATTLTNAPLQAKQFLTTIDWSRPSWDMFIILFFIVAALLYGLSLGRDRVIVILVSLYMALAVVNSAPFIGDGAMSQNLDQFFGFKVSAFVAVFIALFFLMSRSALLATVASTDRSGPWWQVLLFSFLHVGLLISITLSFLPPAASASLAPLTQKIFVQDTSRFLWILLPIVSMIVLKGGSKKHRRRDRDDEE